MAALTGDDEIELLLSQMGGGASTSTSTPSAAATSTEKKERPQKRKKKKKKRKRDSFDDIKKDASTSSFADTRLTQDPFKWPCASAERSLTLGCGLAHDCKGYTCDDDTNYGSNPCQNCGRSPATHELCISSIDSKNDSDHTDPISAFAFASMITASRNARCLMAEYYPKESEKYSRHLSPPMSSISSSSKLIINKLDSNIGKVLSRVKKMEGNGTHQMLISGSDVDLLREKVSELIKTTIAYKNAIKVACSSNTNSKTAGIVLIESRLAALAACDEVYYRCYYASFFLGADSQADLTTLVPHPSTYFSCSGLAWSTRDAGVASLQVFLGEREGESSNTSIAAPLDDATRDLLLKSWCLQERLSSGKGATEQSNPLLVLWQSRFLENIRHLWTTKYTLVKSPDALTAALNKKHCDDHSDPLIRHETYGLSPAAETWRGSIRDYPANFYAYAVPTPQALGAIAEAVQNQGSVCEAGAGTGYMSALLASHAKNELATKVFSYDMAPPRQANKGAAISNEYHGQVPTFINVHQAQSYQQANTMLPPTESKPALLLCYPPPASEMAAIALSQFIVSGGEVIIHVGEWQGTTGDENFESLLRDNFYCKENDIINLPMWGTDATYVTIWRKKSGSNEETQSFSPAVGCCSVDNCSKAAVRRCRFARCLQYCSTECFQNHLATRQGTLSLHMISLSNSDLDFENMNHFVPISWIDGRLPEQGRQARKKRKRKKKHNK